nr:hypothetical protein pFRL5_189 [Streptomyces sp. F8]
MTQVDDAQRRAKFVDLDPYEDRAAAVLDGVGNEFTCDQLGVIELSLVDIVQEAGERNACGALRGRKSCKLDIAVV